MSLQEFKTRLLNEEKEGREKSNTVISFLDTHQFLYRLLIDLNAGKENRKYSLGDLVCMTNIYTETEENLLMNFNEAFEKVRDQLSIFGIESTIGPKRQNHDHKLKVIYNEEKVSKALLVLSHLEEEERRAVLERARQKMTDKNFLYSIYYTIKNAACCGSILVCPIEVIESFDRYYSYNRAYHKELKDLLYRILKDTGFQVDKEGYISIPGEKGVGGGGRGCQEEKKEASE